MIRYLLARTGRVAAVVAIATSVFGGTPLLAVSTAEPQWIIRKDGRTINLEHTRSLGIDYVKLQNALDDLSRGRHADRKRIERLQLWLDFAAATTKQERAKLLKQMGVTMAVTTPADGRAGRMLNFIAGGKVRRHMYLAPHGQVQPEPEMQSGPSDRGSGDYLGRWKDDGNGGCYWDPEDDGPDQCDPNSGGTVCYHEGQASECATDEEIAEMLALAAASEVEVAGYEADFYQAQAELDQYCSQYPEDCQEPGLSEASFGGPSACDEHAAPAGFGPCGQEAVNAVQNIGAHALAIAGMEGAMADAAAAGARLSRATRWSLQGTFLLTAFSAGYAVGTYFACKINAIRRGPETHPLRLWVAQSAEARLRFTDNRESVVHRLRDARIALGNL